ncbi:hypothetical protein GCM10029978_064680 [Actinoallomurus acanthiterrae]
MSWGSCGDIETYRRFGWLAKYREGGMEALKAKSVPGRPSKLDGRQIARLYALIVGNDPRQLQGDFALWTREMVRQYLLTQEAGSLTARALRLERRR